MTQHQVDDGTVLREVIRLMEMHIPFRQRRRVFYALPPEYNDVLNTVSDDLGKWRADTANNQTPETPVFSLDTVLDAVQAYSAADALCRTHGAFARVRSIDFSEVVPTIVIQWEKANADREITPAMRQELELRLTFVFEEYDVLLRYLEP